MKYYELEYFVSGLNTLLNERLKLAGKQKLELLKLRKQIENAFALREEARIGLCIEYSLKTNNQPVMTSTGDFFIPPENRQEFNEKLKEIYDIDVNLEITKSVVKIPESDIPAQAIDALLLISDSEEIFI